MSPQVLKEGEDNASRMDSEAALLLLTNWLRLIWGPQRRPEKILPSLKVIL